jgi:NAD(P)-dependent dehydrogenase (short-subunit alcohol dehydrogenase family)
MENKVILVTGSTDGIGKQTALQLARKGSHILVHGRDFPSAQTVVEEIRNASGNSNVDALAADLASQEQVRQLALDIHDRFDRLNVLINNAGVTKRERQLTEDGLGTTFAVNHLATFLLTNLLLDLIKSSAPSRIINVSSTTHQRVKYVDFDNLQGEKHYDGLQAYALSKLGNILFTYELAERLKDDQVTVNCLHPGVVDTKLLRVNYSPMGISPNQGAETSVYLASSTEVNGITGRYFVNKRPVDSSPLSYDIELRRDFWKVSARLTGLS